MGDLVIRPMRADDVAACEQISDESFHLVDVAQQRAGDPEPSRRPAERSQRWIDRTLSLVATDGPGCWVAEFSDRPGHVVGFATSLRRETLWILATFAVRPDLQARGVGRSLLDAASQHSQGCLRGMLASSSDPRAVRRYVAAGFDLHPQMVLTGSVDPTAAPALGHVREATGRDHDLMDSLDRRVRGAGRGGDHRLLARMAPPLVLETRTSAGYVYADQGSVQALAATDRRTAERLLWAALLLTPDGETAKVAHVTGANQWALRVGTAAGLTVGTGGFLGVRGMRPPTPYLHNGALL
ncbi:GNAT family N-acetyltransferase [Nocardioides acrostichi]|uniref:GNAT family N-acetyltransferase n=1 Tax=Nocardioides acrostichi TaxID=2784339 RepID=A0A930UYN0_9ACTN|nr:GNAT family N-acetyltransferase [Nocardioides acrostichi]MBF4160532.1 GNAT family N-acetyltransferase [Nocardioides acrostichi]